MSPTHLVSPAVRTGFPRVSGDEPTEMHTITDSVRFSPRERG